MTWWRYGLICLGFVTALSASQSSVSFGQDDDDEFRPALLAEYRAGERRIERIDPAVAFDWQAESPDPRLAAGRFEATWRGFVLVRLEAKHRLHAFVQGEVSVELDGQRVLHGQAKQPGWISGDEFLPRFGERRLVVTFRKTERTAQLKLFWSSDLFGVEPLPPELLFHDQPRTDLELIDVGRQHFEAHRCDRCHADKNVRSGPTAPALAQVTSGRSVADVIGKLSAPAGELTDARMPQFGFSRDEAEAVAAFLGRQSEKVTFDKVPSMKEADRKKSLRSGEVLLRSLGCLACHRVGEFGESNNRPFAGPELSRVGERRSLPWLWTWLAHPEKLNSDHRMPVFALSDPERHQLALALSALRTDGAEPASEKDARWTQLAKNDELVERGRNLVEQARCSSCHRLAVATPEDVSTPVRLVNLKHGCLEQTADRARLRPAFGAGLNREAILAFLTSYRSPLAPEGRFARGQRLLEQKNCLACHPRRGSHGLGLAAVKVAKSDDELNGQTPSLVPPSLNGIGDKLLDEALSIAVRGERQPVRMPWLRVRMPRFKHSPDELAELTGYFVEHDRIPSLLSASGGRQPPGASEATDVPRQRTAPTEAARATPPIRGLTPPARHDATDAQTLLAGQSLMSVKGWSCIACHKIGDYEPKHVALGARGSDLRLLGKHMRSEFFLRWIHSPLRVVPGVEMPSYNKPVAGVLDGDLVKQHAALWQALNDPNFQPPTNPANVEQLWVVNPGERPRIIRDVFLVPSPLRGEGQGEGLSKATQISVPRAFAVGFDNGHSLLFDAETASIRQWTFGDFARQQVVGKRWFWQMAGVDVARSLPAPQFALRRKSDPTAHVLMASTRNGEPMGNCRVDQHGVHLAYYLCFVIDEEPDDIAWEEAAIHVEETLTPVTIAATDASTGDKSLRSGVERRLSLRWTNHTNTADFELWFGRPTNMSGVGQPRIEFGGWALLPVPAAQPELKTEQAEQGTGKCAHPPWQRLPVRDQPDDAWEWTELPMKHAMSRPLPTTQVSLSYSAELQRQQLPILARPVVVTAQSRITSAPGFDGVQLPLDASIMPTGFAWRSSGKLVFSSLKGHVFAASDSNNDGLEDRLSLLHEGLSAPYGVLALDAVQLQWQQRRFNTSVLEASAKDFILVASRHDLALLVDHDGDGYCELQQRLAGDWGLTDDYHEWTTGPVRDSKNRLIWGLSSDYTDKNRPKERSRWRGKVLRQILDPRFVREEGPFSLGPTPIGHAFRYPTGIAINERDEVFVSDQQGVQNCFNEVNYLVEGAHYGVPAAHEEDKNAPEMKAAIQIPHPWTRSVNGLCFLTGNEGYTDLKGHGIGCEYNNKFLIRFTTQRVGDVVQGAVYPFSMPDVEQAASLLAVNGQAGSLPHGNFQGPLCIGVSPKGHIYVGSIADSGWAGGNNTGSIVQLKANGQRPNGIREIRATRDGFDIEFFSTVDRARATNVENYSISSYTRVWGGAYATPDSDRHRCKVLRAELSQDGKTAHLQVDPRKQGGYVYEIACQEVASADQPLWPAYGFYTLHQIP